MNSSLKGGQRQLNNNRRLPVKNKSDMSDQQTQAALQGRAPQNRPQKYAAQGRAPQNRLQKYAAQGQTPQNRPQKYAAQGQTTQRHIPREQNGAVDKLGGNRPANSKQQVRDGRSQNTTVSNRARTQTPANRRAEREKRRIDPQQVEINRRRREMHKFYVHRKRKNAFKVFLGRAVIFLVMFAVVFTVACGITMLRFYSVKSTVGGIITYQIGADEDADKTVHKLDYASVIHDGCVYINITEIAMLCEFTTTGDLNDIKLISKNESNDNIKFTMNSPVVLINTMPVRLSAPVYKSEDAVFIPLDFINDYVTGITAEYDSENAKITILREITEYTEATFTNPSVPVYADVCFTLKKPIPSDNIPEDSLDEDIRIATEPKVTADTDSDDAG